MKDTTTPKQKLTTKVFHLNSLAIFFSYIFLLMWQFKVSNECFSSKQFDEIKHVIFLKIGSNKNASNFVVYIKALLIQLWRYSAVSRGKFGHTGTM